MNSAERPRVLLFFIDGVGLGAPDPAVNPFLQANMPVLTQLLGSDWWLARQPIIGRAASLAPTDATLGVEGRPQSASGQATIVTGRNLPQLLGTHIGPWPTAAIRREIVRDNIFSAVTRHARSAVLLNAYPPPFFAAIERGKRSLSSLQFAAVQTGNEFFTRADLVGGRALSVDFSNEGWRSRLNDPEMPLLPFAAAGRRMADLAQQYDFTLFDHWLTDLIGHRGTLAKAIAHLETIDKVIGGILEAWNQQRDLLIITSDHGNMENVGHKRHTRNPVPTILIGKRHAQLMQQVHDLTDIFGIVLQSLSL